MLSKPTWDDVDTVYDRMQAHGLLRVRASPGSIMGHIFSIAVFGRATIREYPGTSLDAILEDYCKWKNINVNVLFAKYHIIRHREGALQPDPRATLEMLMR